MSCMVQEFPVLGQVTSLKCLRRDFQDRTLHYSCRTTSELVPKCDSKSPVLECRTTLSTFSYRSSDTPSWLLLMPQRSNCRCAVTVVSERASTFLVAPCRQCLSKTRPCTRKCLRKVRHRGWTVAHQLQPRSRGLQRRSGGRNPGEMEPGHVQGHWARSLPQGARTRHKHSERPLVLRTPHITWRLYCTSPLRQMLVLTRNHAAT